MKKIKFKLLDYFEYYMLALLLLVILSGVILGIAYRWLPSLCIKEDSHTRLTFVYDLFPPDKKRILRIFSLACFIFLLTVIGYNAAKMNLYYLAKGMRTPAMRISYFWVRIPIVIGCAISIFRLINITIKEVTK